MWASFDGSKGPVADPFVARVGAMQTLTTPARGASPEAIQQHYDVSNDFYGLWLDRTLSYSCALWKENEADDRLEVAQLRKIDYHIQGVQAQGTSHVLDIGCGWGAVLSRLVEEHRVAQATGLTLSPRQAERIVAGGDPRLQVRLESWADHVPTAPYDAIISLGAFEHFARPEWTEADKVDAYRAFFTHCRDWLKPGSRMALQTIAYGNLDRQESRQLPGHRFLLEEVFPETDLPTLENIVAASAGLFEIVTLRNDREDYWRTCRVWFERLLAQRAEAEALVGNEVVARYLRYLKFSATLFHYGQTLLLRIAFRRIDPPQR